MDKEEFVKYVNRIHSYIKKEEAVDNSLRSLSPDFGGFSIGDILDDMTTLLSKLVGDNSDWLGYYIWETDCGENDCANSVTEEDGIKIPFKTPEDVYNLIMEDQIDTIDDSITNYLLEDRNKYKKLYENEKDHSDTLQRIIDAITNKMIDDVLPKEAKEITKKTTTKGDGLTYDELVNILVDELYKEFKIDV